MAPALHRPASCKLTHAPMRKPAPVGKSIGAEAIEYRILRNGRKFEKKAPSNVAIVLSGGARTPASQKYLVRCPNG
jgi:hypothetical protein